MKRPGPEGGRGWLAARRTGGRSSSQRVRPGTALPARADVLIIGGGIIGLTAAYELARGGASVVVLERDRIGRAQSGRNLGFVRQQGRAPAELPLMMVASRRWPQLSTELKFDVEWRQGGNLRLTNDPEKAARYEKWVLVAQEHGLDTRQVTDEEIKGLVPGIQGPWLSGILTASDGHADPEATCGAFEAAVRRLGVRLVEGCEVIGLTVAGGQVTGAATAAGEVAAPVVVLAAGAGSSALARRVGLAVPQRSVRQTVVRTGPVPPLTDVVAWTGELFLRQDVHGRLWLAGASRNQVQLALGNLGDTAPFVRTYLANRAELRLPTSWRELARAAGRPISEAGGDRLVPEANPADIIYCIERARHDFPGAGDIHLERAWAGEIEATPDALPIIDAPPAPRGLVLATGMSGHGFGISPVIGEIIARTVEGKEPGFDLRPFRLQRFHDGSSLEPAHLL
jgi:glycine/D-amino acid oxidase-like deaminating enzyme